VTAAVIKRLNKISLILVLLGAVLLIALKDRRGKRNHSTLNFGKIEANVKSYNYAYFSGCHDSYSPLVIYMSDEEKGVKNSIVRLKHYPQENIYTVVWGDCELHVPSNLALVVSAKNELISIIDCNWNPENKSELFDNYKEVLDSINQMNPRANQ
jgi:hypothetical protein